LSPPVSEERPLARRLIRLALVLAVVLGLAGAASVLLKPRLEHLDREIGPLPVAALDGTPILPASFAGRPWIVNVWMPG